MDITPAMIEAGVHALSCEFGFPSENPVVDYEEAAKRVFSVMLEQKMMEENK